MAESPRVTVAVPSYNHGSYLDAALESIFSQRLPVEVFVMDAASTDDTPAVIRKWEPRLAGWRSRADSGQSAAVNEGIALGAAPYVCWLNSDDWFLEGGLAKLVAALERAPKAAMAYGRAWSQRDRRRRAVYVRPFSEWWMARLNIISQPATLIRRGAWQAVGGLDESLHMALDYDLWWRLFRRFGPPVFVDEFVAVNREHASTKTGTRRRDHYREAMAVVRKHHGSVPLKWWLAQPYAVWYRSFLGR